MAISDFRLDIAMRGLLVATNTGISVPSEPLGTGQNGFTDASFSFTNGTGELEANTWVVGQAELDADGSIYQLIDLNDATNNLGEAVSFDVVKYFFLVITDPAAGKVVHLGNFGAPNGWLGWFGEDGTAEADQSYEIIHHHTSHASPYDGFAVENDGTGGGKLVYVRAPGDGTDTVTIQYVIIGVQRA